MVLNLSIYPTIVMVIRMVKTRLVCSQTSNRYGRNKEIFPFLSLFVLLGLQCEFDQFGLLLLSSFSGRDERSLCGKLFKTCP
jgi:hypothetical protein